MALINRLTRLFRADLHAVLDRIEEPELLLRQSLRDMQEALNQGRLRQAELSENLAQIDTRHAEVCAGIEAIAGELDLCFAEDKEDLARGLLRRRLQDQHIAAGLAERRARLALEHGKLTTTLADQQRRLEAMQHKAALFQSQPPSAEPEAARREVSEEEVELALLRERRARRSS